MRNLFSAILSTRQQAIHKEAHNDIAENWNITLWPHLKMPKIEKAYSRKKRLKIIAE